MKNKVSLIRCSDYNFADVEAAIKQSFDNLGGIEKYINKGDKVLLKLNLLMRKRPELAATTHPEFTRALCKVLIDYGAEVIIGDSPGGPFTKGMLSSVYKGTGIEAVANEVGATLNYNTNSVKVSNPDGLFLKSLSVCDMLNDVDKVISVSKLKTHGMCVFTGAVKNMFGVVPGIVKVEYHINMPEVDDFADALIDVCLASKPVLSFMDGIIGMEGAGPSSGEPRKVGAVNASTSPYHLDKAAIKIAGFEESEVPTVKRSINRGLCGSSFDDIEFTGENIDDFVISDFKRAKAVTPDFFNVVPKFFHGFLKKRLKAIPKFDAAKCVGCSDCVRLCPAKVLELNDKKLPILIDKNKCISCFCCQELCPKSAVNIHRPWLLNLLSR